MIAFSLAWLRWKRCRKAMIHLSQMQGPSMTSMALRNFMAHYQAVKIISEPGEWNKYAFFYPSKLSGKPNKMLVG